MTALRLESFEAVAGSIAEHLVDGRVVVLRGQPWSGRTSLASSIRAQLADVIDVPCVTGSDSAAVLASACDELESATSSGRAAAVLVDDFGLALGTAHGIAFQNRLNALAVDGPHAVDLGVLLVARHNESLTRFAAPGGGSPIAGAAQAHFNTPTLHRAEIVAGLTADGCEAYLAEQLVSAFGGHLHLLQAARQSSRARAPEQLQDEAVMRVVADLNVVTAERLLDLLRHPDRAHPWAPADEMLAPAVYSPENALTQLCPVLAARGVGSLVVGGRTGWPDNPNESVRRFLCRLHGLRDAIWVDRFHGNHLDSLVTYFNRVAMRGCDLCLRMLGSKVGIEGLPARPEQRFRDSLATWATQGLRVEWRIAHDADYDLLHQRMLVSPSRLGGYTLPPCDRITGAHRGGSDSDTILDRAPLALLSNAWSRATPFAHW